MARPYYSEAEAALDSALAENQRLRQSLHAAELRIQTLEEARQRWLELAAWGGARRTRGDGNAAGR